MKTYKHIFFDLDRTLYDFDKNNLATLQEIFKIASSANHNGVIGFDSFHEAYLKINKDLWNLYKKQEISKQELNLRRFAKTLDRMGMDTRIAQTLADAFIRLSPLQVYLLPGAIEILQYLHPKYPLHIITNGFSEIQFEKLKRTGLAEFFRHIIVSEEAGAQKPDPRIFALALQKTGASISDSLIIGDDPHCDIYGGQNSGIDQVWLYQAGETTPYQPTYAIGGLMELTSIL